MVDAASFLTNSQVSVVPGVREDDCVGLGNLLCSSLGEAVIYRKEKAAIAGRQAIFTSPVPQS